jgi:hypothetical protein
VRQIEEDDVKQQQESQPPTPETTEAFRTYEEARLKREATEGRCLLGFVVLSILEQAIRRAP